MTTTAPDPTSPPSLAEVWGLWLSVGYAALLVIAALAVALGWQGVQDALDLRRAFS